MHRTLYDKNTGDIISCVDLSNNKLTTLLQTHPELDYINVYTVGIKNIAVDVATKKLKKISAQVNIPNLIRQQRMGLLSSSDWTQSLDSPLSEAKRAEWAAYRQALRDLPDEQGGVNSISDVVWPSRPQ